MLINNKKLEGTLVHAWKEPAYREMTDREGQVTHDATRVNLIVDESDSVLGAVSDRYTLVRNADFVSALDLAAQSLNVELEPIKGRYKNGRASYTFLAPALTFQAPGDASKTHGTVILTNDYRGGGGLGIKSGLFRLVCTNGLVVGTVSHKDLIRHVGEIDVYGFVLAGLQKLLDQIDVQRLLVSGLAGENFPVTSSVLAVRDRAAAEALVREALQHDDTPGLIPSILADTPDRYQRYLRDSVREDTRDMGENLWALVQLIARTSTHAMGQTAAADDWATRQLNRVRQFANV